MIFLFVQSASTSLNMLIIFMRFLAKKTHFAVVGSIQSSNAKHIRKKKIQNNPTPHPIYYNSLEFLPS